MARKERYMRALATLRLALLLAGLLGLAAHCARFRGPHGTGISDDKDDPVRWTADNVLWSQPLPGIGHSSPIIWGDKVFLQSATRDQRLLLCLDAGSGKEVWKKAVPG